MELYSLAAIALSQPHAAHAAFTHGLSSKWFYLTCTIQGMGFLFQPLETMIRLKLIPALTGQPPPSDEMRDLLALPTRLGGIALTNPTSTIQYIRCARSSCGRTDSTNTETWSLVLSSFPLFSNSISPFVFIRLLPFL